MSRHPSLHLEPELDPVYVSSEGNHVALGRRWRSGPLPDDGVDRRPRGHVGNTPPVNGMPVRIGPRQQKALAVGAKGQARDTLNIGYRAIEQAARGRFPALEGMAVAGAEGRAIRTEARHADYAAKRIQLFG